MNHLIPRFRDSWFYRELRHSSCLWALQETTRDGRRREEMRKAGFLSLIFNPEVTRRCLRNGCRAIVQCHYRERKRFTEGAEIIEINTPHSVEATLISSSAKICIFSPIKAQVQCKMKQSLAAVSRLTSQYTLEHKARPDDSLQRDIQDQSIRD